MDKTTETTTLGYIYWGFERVDGREDCSYYNRVKGIWAYYGSGFWIQGLGFKDVLLRQWWRIKWKRTLKLKWNRGFTYTLGN